MSTRDDVFCAPEEAVAVSCKGDRRPQGCLACVKAEFSGFLFEGPLFCPKLDSFDHSGSMSMRPGKGVLVAT